VLNELSAGENFTFMDGRPPWVGVVVVELLKIDDFEHKALGRRRN
jgi:hypothetical protein